MAQDLITREQRRKFDNVCYDMSVDPDKWLAANSVEVIGRKETLIFRLTKQEAILLIDYALKARNYQV